MRYIFTKYKRGVSKGDCPSCGSANTFSYYYDVEKEEYLLEYGKCDREVKCGYHLSPYEVSPSEDRKVLGCKVSLERKDYFNVIPKDIFEKSLVGSGNFKKFLTSLFGEKISKTLEDYKLGHVNGYDIFWQIDQQGRVRSGKKILYNEQGKRTKNITWVHSLWEDYELKQCLFGEHLIDGKKQVIVVESEKTAIIGAFLHNKFTWVSCGVLHGLTEEKLEVLKGKRVVFIPDKGKAFKIWEKKLQEYLEVDWEISTFVEDCEELVEGDDIADYFLSEVLCE
jgi:hypothetical protein